MADIPASSWSQTDGSNTTSPPDGAPEGMAPSGVNDVIRMVMGAVKRWFAWTIPATTGGTTTAYTLSYSVAPAALVDGMSHLVQFNATCGAAPTLNINSLGAKPLYRYSAGTWGAVASGEITTNMVCRVSYNSGDGSYRIISAATSGIGAAFLAIANTFTATQTMSGAAFNEAVRVDVASASTCDIGAAASNYVRITGTTTITGLGTIASGVRRHVVFGGALTLTYDATALILPGGASITTAAGDTALFLSEGSGNWRCLDYTKFSGAGIPTYLANSLGSDVLLNNTGSYFTGPTVAQGTSGTWYCTGTVTVNDSAGAAVYSVKLWDGTTVIASAKMSTSSVNEVQAISLSGIISAPAGNIRISVNDGSSTSGSILYNATGNSKDSTLTVYRIG